MGPFRGGQPSADMLTTAGLLRDQAQQLCAAAEFSSPHRKSLTRCLNRAMDRLRSRLDCRMTPAQETTTISAALAVLPRSVSRAPLGSARHREQVDGVGDRRILPRSDFGRRGEQVDRTWIRCR
jgi:hypothetical protein